VTRLLPEDGTFSRLQIEDREPVEPRRKMDRRESERRHIELPLRFYSLESGEATGTLCDISAGGMQIIANDLPRLGEAIIVYIDRIGRFEGHVIRADHGTFAVTINATASKLARLEVKLETFLAEEYPDASVSDRRECDRDRRYFVRSEDAHKSLTGYTIDGQEFQCSVVDISLGGLSIKTDTDLSIGMRLKVGTVNGVVIRQTESGYAIKRQ